LLSLRDNFERFKMIKTITIHTRSSYWTSLEHREELEVDADDLGIEIEFQCNLLEKEGFEIKRVIPVNSGNMTSGTGPHYTESVLITAEKQ
jgi:hypothetical protein